jgi:NADPH-dependent curcumin reductase CurA
VDEFETATELLSGYVSEGSIRYRETITKGFENAPQALRDVLSGKNFGKQIIEI